MTRPLRSIVKYLYELLQGHLLQATLNTLIGATLVGFDLLFVWATKLAIDIATHHTAGITLRQTFILIACIMTARIILSICSKWIRATLGVRAQNSMRRHIFGRLLQSEWPSLRLYHTGNLTNRIERDVRDVVYFTTESIPALITTCVQFIGAFLFLFYMDSSLAIIIVCVIPFFVISSKLYIKRMHNLTHDIREHESRIQAIIQETLQHTLVVKTLQRASYFIENLTTQQTALHCSVIAKTRYSTISAGLLSLGFAAGYFVTFAWGATKLSQGLISYGAMLAFIQLVSQIQGPIRNLSKFVPVFITSLTAAERLIEMEEIPQEEDVSSVELDSPTGIEISDLSFSYSPTSRLIFDHFSYTFPPGGITAILGETGSGKTTLIRLLLALMHPTEGKIALIDSKGNRHPIAPHLRCNFSYVPQGNTLISGTIRSNLQQGSPTASEAEMRRVLEIASADFVFQNAQGLDAPCGETGSGLSEGQAQRIAIARALLSNGNILIFDEATSALDADTERLVLKRITENFPNHTLIFITHRPEVLKYADRHLVLSKHTSRA